MFETEIIGVINLSHIKHFNNVSPKMLPPKSCEDIVITMWSGGPLYNYYS